MKEHPILFSSAMVRALIAGTKTQTRRTRKPRWVAGDRLWVRETLKRPDGGPWEYAADGQAVMVAKEHETAMLVWAHHKEQDHCVSIHMPRWASRITLEVVSTWAERLQDISEADAIAEGVRGYVEDGCFVYEDYILGAGTWSFTAKGSFASLWDSINGKTKPWESNPLVYATEFKVEVR